VHEGKGRTKSQKFIGQANKKEAGLSRRDAEDRTEGESGKREKVSE